MMTTMDTEISSLNTNGTQLNDRFLWFDGDSTLEPDTIADLLLRGNKLTDKLFVSSINDEISQFNRVSEIKLSVKATLKDIIPEWIIPKHFKDLDIEKWILDAFVKEIDNDPTLSADDIENRLVRIHTELELYATFSLLPFINTLIYVVETLRSNNVVWGVGRGSSCASYILYLIGIHDVDSVKYELDINEFLR